MYYTSLDNKKIKELHKLHTKKYRDASGLFLVEGYKTVFEAYQAGLLKEIYVLENSDINVPLEPNYISKNVLNYLSLTETPQPIIGVCRKKEIEKIGNKVIILDNVQDPGNIGTIIRSAVAFNVDTIILSKGSVDIYNDKVLRSTMGMLFKMNIMYADLLTLIPNLKNEGYQILGTKVDGGIDIKDINLEDKNAIIMGNEGNGVSPVVLDMCDKYLYIPMNTACESLNVGVATSIIMYEFNKR